MKKITLNLLIILLSTLLLLGSAFASTSYSPAPESVESLIESSDIILTGKLDEILDNSIFYGYQDTAENIKTIDLKTPLVIGLYKTDFHIKVNQLLKGDVDKKKIVLRIISQQLNNIGKINYSMSKNSDKIKKQLFFLKRNIDGTYSLNSTMGALLFKKPNKNASTQEETIVFEFKGEEYNPFGMDNNANTFIKDVKDIISELDY